MPDPKYSADIADYASSVLAANAKWAHRINQTFPQYFLDPEDKQAPKLLWIGCSDSRVQESDATAALPGTVFVHRNIANQFHLADDSVLSVFAYAVKVLGVRHVAIVGHEHCGGAITAFKEAMQPPPEDQVARQHTLFDSLHHIVEHVLQSQSQNHHTTAAVHDKRSNDPNDAITRWLTPLVERIRGLPLPLVLQDEEAVAAAVRIVIEENVKMQVENVVQLDEWVCGNAAVEKPVWVHGWVYDFATGFIRDLGITRELGGSAA